MRAFISRCRALGRDMSLEFLDGQSLSPVILLTILKFKSFIGFLIIYVTVSGKRVHSAQKLNF